MNDHDRLTEWLAGPRATHDLHKNMRTIRKTIYNCEWFS